MSFPYQILSPFVYDIYGDSFKDAVKNFIKINHNLNLQDIIIRDQANTQKYRADVRYYTQEGINKAGITMYPMQNSFVGLGAQNPVGYLAPVMTNAVASIGNAIAPITNAIVNTIGGPTYPIGPIGGPVANNILTPMAVGRVDRKYVHNGAYPLPLSGPITPMVLDNDEVKIGDNTIRFTGYRPLDGGAAPTPTTPPTEPTKFVKLADIFSDTPVSEPVAPPKRKLSVVVGSNIAMPFVAPAPIVSTVATEPVVISPFLPLPINNIAQIAPALQLSDTASEMFNMKPRKN